MKGNRHAVNVHKLSTHGHKGRLAGRKKHCTVGGAFHCRCSCTVGNCVALWV